MIELQRILIVRTDRIGDVVLTLPMVDILKQNFPNAFIAMLVRKYTSELAYYHKSVDEVIPYDNENGLIDFNEILSNIKKYKFDSAFVAYPRLRVAALLKLAAIPVRVGSGYRYYSFLFNKRVYEHRKYAKKHELEYNLSLLEKVGCKINKITPPWIFPKDEHIEFVKNKLRKYNVEDGESFIIIHPGTGGSTKVWSQENFINLGKRILELKNIRIILTGGINEVFFVKRVSSQIGKNCVTIAGELSLMQYAALAKIAKLFIGNSTGPLHIAAAVGTKVIGFYPQLIALSAKRWGPYTPNSIIFSPNDKPLDCKKCRNLKECECMNSISYERVFEAVKNFLN